MNGSVEYYMLEVRQVAAHDTGADDAPARDERPKTRAECRDGERPCPWVSCRHNLILDVRPDGRVVLAFDLDDDAAIEAMTDTCALDVADRAADARGLTLADVAQVMNVTRERIRQIEGVGLAKVNRRLRALPGEWRAAR
jgi:hypothetical protein